MSMHYEILMDKKENPRKCTILPQKHRPDFKIRYFQRQAPIPAFSAELLLHIDGECLSTLGESKLNSFALIDCNWRKVDGALKRVARPIPRLARIPDGFVTAYPRRNREGNDPESGLATIEALFIAAAFLKNWDETLLDNYHFKDSFLELNRDVFQRFGLKKI
jgi:ribosome biogenesis protein Tsr3